MTRWVFNGPTPDSFKTYEKDQLICLCDIYSRFTGRAEAVGGGAAPALPGSGAGEDCADRDPLARKRVQD